MKPFPALCASLSLLALVAGAPAQARNGSGIVGALASAARHAGDGDGAGGVTPVEGMISAADPEGMAATLQGLGYRAELDVDSVGDPVIRSAAAGANFSLYFYGCVENAGCDSLLFSAGFDRTEPMDPARANEWNRSALLAMMYLDDEGDPILNHYLLTRGGIPEEVFAASMREWSQVLGEFQEFIDW